MTGLNKVRPILMSRQVRLVCWHWS